MTHAARWNAAYAAATGLTCAALAGAGYWFWKNPRPFLDVPPSAAFAVLACLIALLAQRAWAVSRRGRVDRVSVFIYAVLTVPIASAYLLRGYEHLAWNRLVDTQTADAVRRLRLLETRQEDYRLRFGRYANEPERIGWERRDGETLNVTAVADSGWAAALALRSGTQCVVWVRDSMLTPIHVGTHDGVPACGSGERWRSDMDDEPMRAMSAPFSPAARPRGVLSAGEWQQYRADARHLASCCADSSQYLWDASIGGEIRATPAIAGDYLIIGAHGSGELAAFDRRNGALVWRTRVPNWIHNDPIVAAGTVYVGYGNKDRGSRFGVFGSDPSGIAAFELTTGRLRWIAPAEGSVMMSPAKTERGIVFLSAEHRAITVDPSTGKRLWEAKLPGRPIMSNPTVSDSTLFVAGDPAYVCAFDTRSGNERWCHHFRGMMAKVGESSPAVDDSLLVVAAVEDTSAIQLLTSGQIGALVRDVRLALNAQRHHRFGQQFAIALRRSDGKELWRVPLRGGRDVPGNAAGTAVIDGDRVFIVSPVGRTVSAISRRGQLLWQQQLSSDLKGAPLLVDQSLVTLLQNGQLVAFDTNSGIIRCQRQLNMPIDRSGPAMAGSTVYFGTLDGRVIARGSRALAFCLSGDR